MPIHVEYSLDIDQLPQECIDDCTVGGQDASAAVDHWLDVLSFTVDRARAIRCLEGYGAWEDLDAESDRTLAERILWLACGDFKEFQVWKSCNPDKDDRDADVGSNVFVLE